MSHAFLRLVSTNGETSYSLLTAGEVVIGRDRSCQIVIRVWLSKRGICAV
ncbi:MAG: hypothetical protein F6K28_01710 [Microcoleus sp. SIO2G3]|nr:hypothetical protein [Microcoleus sp. SIO2G3]